VPKLLPYVVPCGNAEQFPASLSQRAEAFRIHNPYLNNVRSCRANICCSAEVQFVPQSRNPHFKSTDGSPSMACGAMAAATGRAVGPAAARRAARTWCVPGWRRGTGEGTQPVLRIGITLMSWAAFLMRPPTIAFSPSDSPGSDRGKGIRYLDIRSSTARPSAGGDGGTRSGFGPCPSGASGLAAEP